MNTNETMNHAAKTAQFKFGLIAPVIQGLFPDASRTAFYKRVAEKPIEFPDGSVREISFKTLERWVSAYQRGGIDALMPVERSDKGTTRVLPDTAIEEIYRLKKEFPRLNATQIHSQLVQNGFIPAAVSVCAVQRFIKKNDLKSARNPNLRDRKAFEEDAFGRMWQADTCYFPHISEDGRSRRVYAVCIIDDHSRLIVGPWMHSGKLEGWIEGVYYGPQGDCDGYGFTEKLIEWYDYWLKGQDGEFMRGAPIRLFVMGKNIWRDEYEWPLARTRFTPVYLHSGGHARTLLGDGMLSAEKPGDEPWDEYDYDPMNPCPSSTGEPNRMLMQDQRLLQTREDVLVYTTPAVLHETEITGPIVAELYASSSARDTDFVARVGVVRRDGSVYKLGSKLVRARYRNGEIPEPLTPGEIVCYRIEAANISIVLMPGEAIRLDVTSSLFPDADRNMNTFGKVGYDAEGIVAHQRIYHDASHPSALILPIIPDEQMP